MQEWDAARRAQSLFSDLVPAAYAAASGCAVRYG
jgi:hypothetical protein